MPLCVCGPCWGDLGDILRLQEASGPNMIGLTDDRFPHYGGVLSKGFLKDSEMLRGACLASTWLFSILECTAMLMNVCRAGRARAHSCRGTFRHSGNPRHKPSSISRSNSHRQSHGLSYTHSDPCESTINHSLHKYTRNTCACIHTLFPPHMDLCLNTLLWICGPYRHPNTLRDIQYD